MIATYKIAMAVGCDAGNLSASRAGRKIWNEEDFNAAEEAFRKVFGGD